MKKTDRRKKTPNNEPGDDNLFNRTSGRVHGYSSRLASNLRFSISLRTAIGYVLLLLHALPGALIVLVLVYGYLQMPAFLSTQQRVIERVEEISVQTVLKDADAVSMPEMEGVWLRVLDSTDTVRWRDDRTEALHPGFEVYEGWGVTWDPTTRWPYVQYEADAPSLGSGWQVQVLFDLHAHARMLGGLGIALGAFLVVLSYTFLTRGRTINRELLQPLYDIADTTQRLGEKNLSERINVAGTQNELRDLAVVLNDMLDRIETGYNRQRQFVSDASHELRTPIAVIQGYANLLERWGKDSPSVRDEAIGAILQETQSMKELVENLLFLARHDKKTLKYDLHPFGVADLVRETAKDAELIAREHKIQTGMLDDCVLLADRGAVKQALRIFLDNAVKYTPAGGTVRLASEVRNGWCFIHVTDSGVGIKKAELAKIFDRFYRADDARNSQTGGHGLGLSIARIIVSSHGGQIRVKSKPGEGSTFTIALPVIEVVPGNAETPPATEPSI